MPLPSAGSSVSGKATAGPIPQVKPEEFFGEKNAENVTSLKPNVDSMPGASDGWLTSGMIHRPMRFHSSFNENGTTGWTFSTVRVAS